MARSRRRTISCWTGAEKQRSNRRCSCNGSGGMASSRWAHARRWNAECGESRTLRVDPGKIRRICAAGRRVRKPSGWRRAAGTTTSKLSSMKGIWKSGSRVRNEHESCFFLRAVSSRRFYHQLWQTRNFCNDVQTITYGYHYAAHQRLRWCDFSSYQPWPETVRHWRRSGRCCGTATRSPCLHKVC